MEMQTHHFARLLLAHQSLGGVRHYFQRMGWGQPGGQRQGQQGQGFFHGRFLLSNVTGAVAQGQACPQGPALMNSFGRRHKLQRLRLEGADCAKQEVIRKSPPECMV